MKQKTPEQVQAYKERVKAAANKTSKGDAKDAKRQGQKNAWKAIYRRKAKTENQINLAAERLILEVFGVTGLYGHPPASSVTGEITGSSSNSTLAGDTKSNTQAPKSINVTSNNSSTSSKLKKIFNQKVKIDKVPDEKINKLSI